MDCRKLWRIVAVVGAPELGACQCRPGAVLALRFLYRSSAVRRAMSTVSQEKHRRALEMLDRCTLHTSWSRCSLLCLACSCLSITETRCSCILYATAEESTRSYGSHWYCVFPPPTCNLTLKHSLFQQCLFSSLLPRPTTASQDGKAAEGR